MIRKFDIAITVLFRGKEHVIMTYPGEYRSLMALLYDKLYIDDFGECKGTGRCGTCHIHILGHAGKLLNRIGNENGTLAKMTFAQLNSRLACQVMVDRQLNGLRIEVIQDNEANFLAG